MFFKLSFDFCNPKNAVPQLWFGANRSPLLQKAQEGDHLAQYVHVSSYTQINFIMRITILCNTSGGSTFGIPRTGLPARIAP